MNGDEPFDFAGSKPVRLAIGAIAGTLALLLAFQVGEDGAAMLLGGHGDAATRPAPRAGVARPEPLWEPAWQRQRAARAW